MKNKIDILALTSLPWVEPGKYSVPNWSSQNGSGFPYSSSHSQPTHNHANFMSTSTSSTVTGSFGQPYYPPTPPKDMPHDTLLDSSNKQQEILNNKNYQYHPHQNLFPNTTSPTTSAAAAAAAAAYHHHHNWGHVLKDSAAFWSTMKSPSDSPSKMSSSSNSKKKPSQGWYMKQPIYSIASLFTLFFD